MIDDTKRIEEGRRLAHILMRTVFASAQRDFWFMTVLLVHQSSKAFEQLMQQGGEPVGMGWAVLVGGRAELPRDCPITEDQLAFMISAGGLHLLTGFSYEDLVSAKGGQA